MTNCSKCGERLDIHGNFCRRCGEGIGSTQQSANAQADQLTGRGIATMFLGDGFLIVAVILSSAQSTVTSLLWLLLLIPAFLFFGRGFYDLFLARQLRRRAEPDEERDPFYLNEARPNLVDVFKDRISGDLEPVSVTERTTRGLK